VLTSLISCLWLCFTQIHVFMCFLPCFVLRSAFVCAYMFGFMFFHAYALGFHVFTHALPCLCLDLCLCVLRSIFSHICVFRSKFLHVRVLESMFLHACFLAYMFFTCLALSSMCLCAPCHVCVPRPRLCLSCHVLL